MTLRHVDLFPKRNSNHVVIRSDSRKKSISCSICLNCVSSCVIKESQLNFHSIRCIMKLVVCFISHRKGIGDIKHTTRFIIHRMEWKFSHIYRSYIYICVPRFNVLSTFGGCRYSVYIRRIIYKFVNVCTFDSHDCCGLLEGWALVNRFNHTSGVIAVNPTDRPKSVRNHCVIDVFGDVFMLSRCVLDFLCGCRGFVTGLSQISSFFSHY